MTDHQYHRSEIKAPAPRWYSSLFIKCLAAILVVFLTGSLLVFLSFGFMLNQGLKLGMSPDDLESHLQAWVDGKDPETLSLAAESPYCQAVLGAAIVDILNRDSELWRRYNRSQAFTPTMSLALEYRRADKACRFTSGDQEILRQLMDGPSERLLGLAVDSIPGHWLGLAEVSPAGRPDIVVTVGFLIDDNSLGNLVPELKALGHVTIHMSLISILSALLVTIYIVRRIRRVERAAAKWAEGRLDVRIGDPHRDEIGRLAATFDHMADALSKNIEVKQSLATAEERNRLARDLHDTAKQRCFALGLRLSLLARTCSGDDKQTELVQSALELTKLLQNDMTDVIQRYSGPTIAQAGLSQALHESLDLLLKDSDIRWKVELNPEDAALIEKDPHLAGQLLLISTEGAANSLRHSQAETLTISFYRIGNVGEWRIADDGIGFDTSAAADRGMGISSMRQRAESLPEGQLSIMSGPGRGTKIKATFKLSAPGQEWKNGQNHHTG